MTWMALLIGIAAYAALAAASGPARRPARDTGTLALRAVGGAGLLSLAAAALMSGSLPAAALAAAAAAVLVTDPRVAARRAARWARRRAAAFPVRDVTE